MNLRTFWLAGAFACLTLPSVELASAEPTTQAEALHALNRLAFGPRPGDLQRVMQMGVDRYIDKQLHPERSRCQQS
jgi:hypothetical protein